MITIVDYGVGNLSSVANMFKKVGATCEITQETKRILRAEKLLLPGVGAFDIAMKKIKELKLKEALNKKVLEEKIPILGICLGMQLLTKGSDEGEEEGLGWIPAYTHKAEIEPLKVPHIGWNEVKVVQSSSLIDNLDNASKYYKKTKFYFVHSYFVRVEKEENSLLKTTYGVEFDSAIVKDNIYGVQFHPEKSHLFGMKLFENFSKI